MDKKRRNTRGRTLTKSSMKTSPSASSGRKSVTIVTGSTDSPKKSPGRPAASPSRRASPGRTRTSPARKRTSPLRRSSRPRSTIPTVQSASASTASNLSTTKEEAEAKVSYTNLPTTLTTNTSTRAPAKVTTTSSTQSTYSSPTQKTATKASGINKLTDFIRRSASKTFSSVGLRSREDNDGSFTPSQHTDGESHYTRSVSRSLYDGDGRYSRAEFSDSEMNEENKSNVYDENEHHKSNKATAASSKSSSARRKLSVPTEFGGWIGISLLLILIPPLVYYLQWCCTPHSCKLKMPNFHGILEHRYLLQNVFNIGAVGSYLAFNLSIFVLSTFLFGRGVRLPGNAEYKFNAHAIAFVSLIALCAAQYYKVPVGKFIIENYLNFCIYGFLNAYFIAWYAYLRSDMLKEKEAAAYNVYAKSGNTLVDYALGRQINPKWLGLVEFKQVFYKVSLLSTYIYAMCLLLNIVQLPAWPKDGKSAVELITYLFNNVKYDKTALLCTAMLISYIWDCVAFEHHLASSFELQGEGFGCLLLLRYAATPYLLSAVARYFYQNKTPLNCTFAAYIPILIFGFGLILKRLSNALKYKYRVQPKHQHFKHVETIHTFQGKRLLLGPIWGNLRQPNYLGDIIAIIGMGLPLAMRFAWPPFISLTLIIILLVHRCLRVNARNTARYHSSWVRYQGIARNYLIPNIF